MYWFSNLYFFAEMFHVKHLPVLVSFTEVIQKKHPIANENYISLLQSGVAITLFPILLFFYYINPHF